jgi:hypothetical protein
MKPYILLSALLCFISCTTENVPGSDSPVTEKGIMAKAKKDNLPANPANPFDYVGIAYGAIQEHLLNHPESHNMTAIFSLCQSNIAFQVMYLEEYTPISDATLVSVFTDAETDLKHYLNSTRLTEEGQSMFLELIDSLGELKANDERYDVVYDFLAGYENTVSLSDLHNADKQILLTTFSILRNGYYVESRKRRKDRDWELSIGHIAATAYGAEVSEANSITASLGGRFVLVH